VIYNRKARLERWIGRIHTELQDNGPDKHDILKFVDYLQEKDKSILWIIRCITALLQLNKEIKKPFSQVTKEDIKKLFEWMNDRVQGFNS
jgi:light-regulated signal transduction histidine kinase (bacteriophytochrome)